MSKNGICFNKHWGDHVGGSLSVCHTLSPSLYVSLNPSFFPSTPLFLSLFQFNRLYWHERTNVLVAKAKNCGNTELFVIYKPEPYTHTHTHIDTHMIIKHTCNIHGTTLPKCITVVCIYKLSQNLSSLFLSLFLSPYLPFSLFISLSRPPSSTPTLSPSSPLSPSLSPFGWER